MKTPVAALRDFIDAALRDRHTRSVWCLYAEIGLILGILIPMIVVLIALVACCKVYHWTMLMAEYGRHVARHAGWGMRAGLEAAWLTDRVYAVLTWPPYVLTGMILGVMDAIEEVKTIHRKYVTERKP